MQEPACPTVTPDVGFIHSSGVNTWRDQLRPTQLLQNVARFKGFPPPVLSENGNRIRYGGQDYSLDEFGKHVAMYCKLLTKYSDSFICWTCWGGARAEQYPNYTTGSPNT